MEAQLKTASGRLAIKVEGGTVKELFKQIAAIDEIFNAEHQCGLCQSTDLRFVVRTVDENDYYELRCKCGGRFQFGQTKKGGSLFPKRRDEPNGGWSKYVKEAENAA